MRRNSDNFGFEGGTGAGKISDAGYMDVAPNKQDGEGLTSTGLIAKMALGAVAILAIGVGVGMAISPCDAAADAVGAGGSAPLASTATSTADNSGTAYGVDRPLYDDIDTDNSGQISPAEFRQFMDGVMRFVDTDADGSMSFEEAAAGNGPNPATTAAPPTAPPPTSLAPTSLAPTSLAPTMLPTFPPTFVMGVIDGTTDGDTLISTNWHTSYLPTTPFLSYDGWVEGSQILCRSQQCYIGKHWTSGPRVVSSARVHFPGRGGRCPRDSLWTSVTSHGESDCSLVTILELRASNEDPAGFTAGTAPAVGGRGGVLLGSFRQEANGPEFIDIASNDNQTAYSYHWVLNNAVNGNNFMCTYYEFTGNPPPPPPPTPPIGPVQYQFNSPMSCGTVNHIPLGATPLMESGEPLALGAGAFTAEVVMSLNDPTTPTQNVLTSGGSNDGGTWHMWIHAGIPRTRFGAHAQAPVIEDAAHPITNGSAPFHFAVVRAADSSVRTFVNGVLAGTGSSTLNINWMGSATIGTNPSVCPQGRIQVVQACVGCGIYSMRITQGAALYDSDFLAGGFTNVDSCEPGTDCFIPAWPAATCAVGGVSAPHTYTCTRV